MSRETIAPTTCVLDGASIVEGLAARGYHTLCVGGVGFFNRKNPLGLVLPSLFIPVAEESGLIGPLSEWVLREACRQNKAWQDEGLPPARVSVNLSARVFQQRDIAKLVMQVLAETGLEPQYLELELTESTIMRNAEVYKKVYGTP